MQRKRAYIPLLIVCSIVILGALAFKLITQYRFSVAKAVAEGYVEAKYDFDVEYLGGRFSWIDPSQYHIYFKKGKDELKFTVLVQDDLSIRAENVSGKTRFVADSYLYSKFTMEAETYIEEALKNDVGGVRVDVYCNNSALYAYSLPADVGETSDIDELLQKMDYSVVLHYDELASGEANSKFKTTTEILQEYGVKTDRLTVEDTGTGLLSPRE